jgi:small basic protein
MPPWYTRGQMININDRWKFLHSFLFNNITPFTLLFLEGKDIYYNRRLGEIMEEGIRYIQDVTVVEHTFSSSL